MIWDVQARPRVFVVDPNREAYGDLVNSSASHNTDVVFFADAKAALRINPDDAPAMWVINMALPDMDGSDLHRMLRSRGVQRPIALVGDEYRVEDEIAARSAGAEMYFAKSMLQDVITATTTS